MIGVFFLFFAYAVAPAQNDFTPYFYRDHPSHQVLDLVLSHHGGRFPFPLFQPTRTGDLAEILRQALHEPLPGYERYWLEYLLAAVGKFPGVQPGAIDSESQWLLRGDLGPFLRADERNLITDYSVDLIGAVVGKNYCFFNRTRISPDFKRDPLYAGDRYEWIVGRGQDVYMQAGSRNLQLFLGRLDRNWGPPGGASLILSDHPYSYDHIGFSAQSKRVRFSFFAARLDDQSGFRKKQFLSARRYLALHRMDLNFSPTLKLALTEAIVYGGENRDFELGFLNPANFFYGEIRNGGTSGNVFYALDLFFRPWTKFQLWAQLMVDDIIVNNEPGQNDRARDPDRYICQLQPYLIEPFFPGLDLSFRYVHASNEVYKSMTFWENYTFRGKGLAYPANSHDRFSLGGHYWGLPPLAMQLEVFYQRQGESEVTDIFTLEKKPFLLGTVERAYGLNLGLSCLRRNITVQLAGGISEYGNYRHIHSHRHTDWHLNLTGTWYFSRVLTL